VLAFERHMRIDVPEGRSGRVTVERFTISQRMSRTLGVEAARNGRGCAPPGVYTRMRFDGQVGMSDVPDIMIENLPPYIAAQRLGGRVLVNGLGLGLTPQAVLCLPNVEHCDVVELDADVIALVGPHLKRRFGDRVTIHHADAYKQTGRWSAEARWSVVWHDVWGEISAHNLPSMQRLKRAYQERSDWQGCWCEVRSWAEPNRLELSAIHALGLNATLAA
jgi:hypothetical protein